MTHGEASIRGNDLALVEAALFLASRPLTRRALAKLLGDVPLAYVDQLLADLRDAYADATKGIELVVEEGRALLRVKAPYVDRVAHLAPQQDIAQPVLRTLAVIAYNQPATQADVVRTRGNKAYEHIQELTERGLVRSEEHGRTLLLHVTDEFLRHFGLSTIEEFRFHVAVPAEVGEGPAPEQQEVRDG
jgi:segregation and condensation protein B